MATRPLLLCIKHPSIFNELYCASIRAACTAKSANLKTPNNLLPPAHQDGSAHSRNIAYDDTRRKSEGSWQRTSYLNFINELKPRVAGRILDADGSV